MKKVYSYHTFYFPFVWNMNNTLEFKDYIDEFKNTLWEITDDEAGDIIKAYENSDIDLEKKYRKYHYFSRSAREIVSGMGKGFVTNLLYDRENIHNKAKYVIQTKEKTYELLLNGIRIKVYNTGIAVLVFECKNTDYKTVDDVKCINEYGRRLFAPFLGASSVMCADKIGIKFSDGTSAFADLEKLFEVKKYGEVNISYIPQFVTELLPEKVRENIIAAIDDRMFIACLLNDEEYANKSVNYTEDNVYSADLYEYIFVNKPHSCGCTSPDERNSHLSKAIYHRWLGKSEKGITLWAVTHNSFMGITNVEEDYLVEQPFLCLYTEMLALVIAQRASILRFDYIASELSSGFEKNGMNQKRNKIKKLVLLQEKYIAFLNQFMNCEISGQEQGIELYQMMQEKTGIESALSHLSEEIRVMYEEASVIQSFNIAKYGAIIAVIALLIQIIQWIIELF